ncbi:MAG: hypothetical protein Q7T71_02910, partial [Herbiconiux sp.]|nr:hypothetical protein [Herbiconiux sp.]
TASRAAVAELPRSAAVAEHPHGAVVVVDGGSGWPQRALDAVGAGAVGLVVSDPVPVPLEDADRLIAALGRVPVALDRALLRPDAVADALAAASETPATLLTAVCAAATAEIGPTVCDAVGWLRVLGSAPLRLAVLSGRGSAALALLEGGAEATALTARVLVEGSSAARARITAVGPERTEVGVTRHGAPVIRVDREGGALGVAPRFETRQRLALRRVLEAVAGGEGLTDLGDFAADAAIAVPVVAAL